MTVRVDLAVIGGGPAGQKGAIQGAKAGKRVVVVDRLGMLGGACLNQGTVPSKTLRAAILDMTDYIQAEYFGNTSAPPGDISIDDLKLRVNKVIEDQNRVLTQQNESNDIVTSFGAARFADARTISTRLRW